MPTFTLIDGHSLAYRAFHALPTDLSTPAGQVTNAVFGFTSMVIKLLAEEHPDAVTVAWDTPGGTFRSVEYPAYKAQRQAAPDLFRSQLPLMGRVVEVLGLQQVRLPGYEADDVIATLARRAAGTGWDVQVVTGDRDAFQLIDDRITVLYLRRGVTDTVLANREWIRERYGIDPERYPDYAALRGDTSDNLPGVPGVGEKTAARLLQGYGTLEGIYEHIGEQTPRLATNLAAAKDQVFLNRRLTVLVDDAPIGDEGAQQPLQPWDPTEVRHVFDELAFKMLWERLVDAGGRREPGGGETLEVETRHASASDWANLGGPLFLEPLWRDGTLQGVAVAASGDEALYGDAGEMVALAPMLADPRIAKNLYQAKPLHRWLLELGLDLQGVVFDLTVASYLINPGARTPRLEEAAKDILDLELERAPSEEKKGQATLDSVAGPESADVEGGGRRVVALARLAAPLRERVDARGGGKLFDEVELPLIRVLARMEVAGIGVDREYLTGVAADLRGRIGELETRIHGLAGESFNVNSTLQLRRVLFDHLGLPVVKKTPKGAPSTDAAVLGKLAADHPIAEALVAYRELEKLRSTYVDGLLPLIAADGRIHARFNQTAAATGRLSSEQPNLQNIPVRSAEGRSIRRAFIPGPGSCFVAADYSQIELRILAHLSGDPGLLSAFATDSDIHRATAERVFATSEVTPDLRRRAKVINFGLLYGMEAYGLAQRLDISQEEAAAHMDAYFAQFPEVSSFLDGVVAEARHQGYTTTIFGRRRYLPELAAGRHRDRQAGERMALNAPIQGSAADVIKKAMVELDATLEQEGDRGRILVQVHDELVLEVPADEADRYAALAKATMENIVELAVPLVVDIATGPDWASCKP